MKKDYVFIGAVLLIAAVAAAGAFSLSSASDNSCNMIPLTPDQVEKLRSEGRLEQVIRLHRELRRERTLSLTPRNWEDVEPALGERELAVLMIDFNDNVFNLLNYSPSHYDDLLFSRGERTPGSMYDYYWENSYGQLAVDGKTFGPYRAPQSYLYYTNGQYGMGAYPRNTQGLLEDVIHLADPDIDFSQYDKNNDGVVDGLIMVHAGPEGAGGDGNAIWSHKWAPHSELIVDGVKIAKFTIQPEDGKAGVFAHEFGHVLGMPDLYDYGYDSSGVGVWSIMAAGSHSGRGESPVHFDAWCKVTLGWVTPVDVIDDMEVEIPPVEEQPVIYRMWRASEDRTEYFLLEYRKKIGFDESLRAEGLLIYHCDNKRSDNDSQCCGPGNPHYLVAVEQADGRCDLENYRNSGDDGDPYPGSTDNRIFDLASNPNSNDYEDEATFVGVEILGETADGKMRVRFSSGIDGPYLRYRNHTIRDPEGDGDGFADPGELIDVKVRIKNFGLDAANVTATLSTESSLAEITGSHVTFPELPSNVEGESENGFALRISADATLGDQVPLEMTLYVNGVENRVENFMLLVGAVPLMQISSVAFYYEMYPDGQVNPGEMVICGLSLTNNGAVAADDVLCEVTVEDPNLEYGVQVNGNPDYDNKFHWDKIEPGEEKSTDYHNWFFFTATPLTPNNHEIIFQCLITDAAGREWNETINLTVVDNVGPNISSVSVNPQHPSPGEQIIINALMLDGEGVAAAFAWVEDASGANLGEITLYDDGEHDDDGLGDNVFGGYFDVPGGFEKDFLIGIKATDGLGNTDEKAEQTGFTTRTFQPAEQILLVDDDERNLPRFFEVADFDTYYSDSLDRAGRTYDRWETFFRGAPASEILSHYSIVIWETGWAYGQNFHTLTEADRTALKEYLDGGGRLFLTSQGMAAEFQFFDPTALDFVSDYLKVDMEYAVTNNNIMKGVLGDPISAGIGIDTYGGDGSSSTILRTFVYPKEGATTIFVHDIDGEPTSAVRVETDIYRAVFLTFPFEAISEQSVRDTLMERILNWLVPPVTPTPTVTPTTAPTPVALSVTIDSNKNAYVRGENMMVSIGVANNGNDVQVNAYIAVQALGEFFFWPDFRTSPNPIPATLPPGMRVNGFPIFTATVGDWGIADMTWHFALTDAVLTILAMDSARIEFH